MARVATTTLICDGCGARLGEEPKDRAHVKVSVENICPGRPQWVPPAEFLWWGGSHISGDYCEWTCLLRRLSERAQVERRGAKSPLTEEAPNPPPREGWVRKGGLNGPPVYPRPSPPTAIPREVGP